MNIQITVTHELSEKTLSFIASLFGKQVSTPAAVLTLENKVTKPEKTAKVAKETPAIAESGEVLKETKPSNGQAITHEMIRAKVVSLRDAGKKDDTVKLMEKFQLEGKLSNLPEDKRPEFMNALNAIA